jgi:hypothetical protein
VESLILDGLRKVFLDTPFGVTTLLSLAVAAWAVRELLRCKDKEADRVEKMTAVVEGSKTAMNALTALMEARTVALMESTRTSAEHDRKVIDELSRVEKMINELRQIITDYRR